MSPWPFVTAAYVVTIGGTAAVALWSWVAMKRAERSSPGNVDR